MTTHPMQRTVNAELPSGAVCCVQSHFVGDPDTLSISFVPDADSGPKYPPDIVLKLDDVDHMIGALQSLMQNVTRKHT